MCQKMISVFFIIFLTAFSTVAGAGINRDDLFVYYKKGEAFTTTAPLVLMYSSEGMAGRRLVLAVPSDVARAKSMDSIEFAAPPSDNIHLPPECSGSGKYGFCHWKQSDIIELVPSGVTIRIISIRLYGASVNRKHVEEVRAFGVLRSKQFGAVEIDLSDLSVVHFDEQRAGHIYDIPGPNLGLLAKRAE
ncbi:MAG TPA: hypothetical protein VGH80_03690 [Xanthomonadaceae bacterium]|jgi:hypothetical protein